MDQRTLPEACSHGALIYASTRADRVRTQRGRVTALECQTASGQRLTLRGDVIVLAASALQTPALLLRSGLRQGPVGDGLQCHPGASMAGRFDEKVRLWRGATQGHEVIGLRREGIKFEALGYDMAMAASRLKGIGPALSEELAALDHFCNWGAAIRAEARGHVKALGKQISVHYSLTTDDLRRLRRGVSVLGQLMLAAGARYVTPGVYGFDHRVTSIERMAQLEQVGPLDPRAYMFVATHLFSTCRMGSDPRRAVVRPDFRHHHLEGLYLADSSVFPSNTGVNPQTAIIAIARLCAAEIATI